MKQSIWSVLLILSILSCSLRGSNGNTNPGGDPNNEKPAADDENTDYEKFVIDHYPDSTVKDFYLGKTNALKLLIEFSGFGLRHEYNRNSSGKIESKRGINFDPWNLEIMQAAMQNGIGITLDDYVVALQMAADGSAKPISARGPDLDLVLREKVLSDIRNAANLPTSDKSGLRFMAHALVALGREADVSYDLLSPKVTGKEILNAVQLGLLSQSFAAELFVAAQVFKPQNLPSGVKLSGVKHLGVKAFIGSLDNKKLPCTMTDSEGLIMDAVAGGSGSLLGGVQFFKGVLDRLSELSFIDEVGLAKYTKMALAANVSLNYIKLIWSVVAFKATIKVTPSPLIRTKDRKPGAKAILLANFKLDIGNFQIINCIRPALNAAGVDFSLPQDGPLVGSKVEWSILSKIGSSHDIIETVGVDPLRQETDVHGNNEITIQGKPQSQDLVGKKLVEQHKKVKVQASVNLKNKNPKQDAIDLFSGLAGITALWSLPIEILYRKPLLFNGYIKVPVVDWKEVVGSLLKVRAVYHKSRINDAHADRGVAGAKDIGDELTLNLELLFNPKGGLKVEILSLDDKETTYTDDFPNEFIAGEGCTATQTVDGRIEIFEYKEHTSNAQYKPAYTYPPEVSLPPDKPREKPAEASVSFALDGVSKARGWRYKPSHASCPIYNKAITDESSYLRFKFDPLKVLIENAPEIIIDQRKNGEGWLITVTEAE
jgi:hypothetical protein